MTKQKNLANFLGVSPSMLSALKNKTRQMGKETAIQGESRTGIPKEELLFLDGEKLIERLQKAYTKEGV